MKAALLIMCQQALLPPVKEVFENQSINMTSMSDVVSEIKLKISSPYGPALSVCRRCVVAGDGGVCVLSMCAPFALNILTIVTFSIREMKLH